MFSVSTTCQHLQHVAARSTVWPVSVNSCVLQGYVREERGGREDKPSLPDSPVV